MKTSHADTSPMPSRSSVKLVRRGLIAVGSFVVGAAVFACTGGTDQANDATKQPSSDGSLDDAPVTSLPADSNRTNEAGPGPEAGTADSGLTGKCADTFGDKLTVGFGRIDGIVYAVQKPSDTSCALPNDDHVIVQVLMNGAVYRLVTNVLSNGVDPKVRFAMLPHALPAPAFAEGWHTGLTLDYPTTLDVHNDDFAPFTMDELVAKIAAEVKVGDKVSIYAQSGKDRPESAHKIHRDKSSQDGAIVISPTGTPKFLLFHFDEQVF